MNMRRSAILNSRFDDEVTGQIVGKVKIRGGLFYNGRQQGCWFWADTEKEVISFLTDRKNAYVTQYQDIPGLLDDGPEWEIRIFQD